MVEEALSSDGLWRSKDLKVSESRSGSDQVSRRFTASCWQTTLLITWNAGSAEMVFGEESIHYIRQSRMRIEDGNFQLTSIFTLYTNIS